MNDEIPDKKIPPYLTVAILILIAAIFYIGYRYFDNSLERERQNNITDDYLKNLFKIPSPNLTEEQKQFLEKKINESNITGNFTVVNSTEIPFYQRLVLLVKYDKTACPNLSLLIGGENQTRPIEQVLNISREIYFIRLGRYNTKDPNSKVEFTWVNKEGCQPETFLMTNNDFLIFLNELGVEFENKTEEPVQPAQELALKRNI